MTDAEIASLFKRHGLYRTSARERIVRILSAARRPLSAAEIREALPLPRADLATVYRTLNILAHHGIVVAFHSGKERRYLLDTAGRHEHVLLCLGCGASEPVRSFSDTLLEEEADTAGRGSGFKVMGHSVVHYGYCAVCMREDRKPCKEDVK